MIRKQSGYQADIGNMLLKHLR